MRDRSFEKMNGKENYRYRDAATAPPPLHIHTRNIGLLIIDFRKPSRFNFFLWSRLYPEKRSQSFKLNLKLMCKVAPIHHSVFTVPEDYNQKYR